MLGVTHAHHHTVILKQGYPKLARGNLRGDLQRNAAHLKEACDEGDEIACISVSVLVCVYVSIYTCVRVCLYVCMYVCMYAEKHVMREMKSRA